VERVCARLLRSDTLAPDAAQEVFARAFQRAATLRGENVPGWLKAIAVNTCLNIIDREKRWAPLEHAGAPAASEPAADAKLIAAERLATARRLIAQLPQKQKVVFCLKYIDGCSYDDIERLTGFSNKDVKSYLQNARRNFGNWWRAAGEGDAWTN
jgi:RNA polymerase sigma-70 factor (ECF subfamily)